METPPSRAVSLGWGGDGRPIIRNQGRNHPKPNPEPSAFLVWLISREFRDKRTAGTKSWVPAAARSSQDQPGAGGQERSAEVADGAGAGGVGEQPAQQQAGQARGATQRKPLDRTIWRYPPPRRASMRRGM